MPRIRMPRIRKTIFPDQMFMHRQTGKLSRSDLFPEDWGRIYPEYVPVQGPDLPLGLEQRRQYLRDAQEAYEADLAEERARQAYNRKVAAWNSYQMLPYRQRQYIANKDDIMRALRDYSYVTPYAADNMEFPVYESFDEFPDELSDAPWRY